MARYKAILVTDYSSLICLTYLALVIDVKQNQMSTKTLHHTLLSSIYVQIIVVIIKRKMRQNIYHFFHAMLL